jgi:Helix-turn-helix domain
MISIPEAAAKLGLTRQRVWQLCRARRIPGARLLAGRIWQVPDEPTITPVMLGRPLKS